MASLTDQLMAFRCNRDMLGMRLESPHGSPDQLFKQLVDCVKYSSGSSRPVNLVPEWNGGALSQELVSGRHVQRPVRDVRLGVT
jgi:hypothetical protein